jgi:parallel beta-helix repeat protein
VMSLNTKKLIIFVAIGLVCSVGFVTLSEAQQLLLSDNKIINSSGNIITNETTQNNTAAEPPLKISPSPNPTFVTETPKSPIEGIALQNYIHAAIITAEELPLQSDTITSSSNIVNLNSTELNVGSNTTIRNLIIDASNLGEHNAVLIQPGVENVLIENITIINHFANSPALLSNGSKVTLRNINFINVSKSYPIHIASSHTIVEGCFSKDESIKALVFIDGGISDVHINSNLAVNRPLINAWNGTALLSHDIWVENNTLLNFPNPTYGIIFLGVTGSPQRGLYENITIIGNKIEAGPLAFNAIAIYGLSRNVLVANNTVDQSLSYHNAIGISSGVNVVVTKNIVFGSVECEEGGIEVESNPVHNRNTGVSENVNVTENIVYHSMWGIYVRVYATEHPNFNGTENAILFKSKNIIIENNTVYACTIGINLLHGENIIVRNNNISDNTIPFLVDNRNVLNYTVSNNVGYS